MKDDQLDAWSFADALRVDGQNWKALRPEDPLIKELRLLCRDEVSLIEQRTAFINQLRQALGEYYPAALEGFEDWSSVSAWMFLQRFPTPELLAQAGKRQWQKSSTVVGSGVVTRGLDAWRSSPTLPNLLALPPPSKPRASWP